MATAENDMVVLKKLTIQLPYDPAISLLSTHTHTKKKKKTPAIHYLEKDPCTPTLIALFTIAKIQKQPKCLSIDEWIKRCNTHTNTQNKKNFILFYGWVHGNTQP